MNDGIDLGLRKRDPLEEREASVRLPQSVWEALDANIKAAGLHAEPDATEAQVLGDAIAQFIEDRFAAAAKRRSNGAAKRSGGRGTKKVPGDRTPSVAGPFGAS